MHALNTTAVCFAFMFLAASTPAEEMCEESQDRVTASVVNRVGASIFDDVTKNDSENVNLALSPLSVTHALTLLYGGAEGETAAQIRQLLFGNEAALTPDELAVALSQLSRTIGFEKPLAVDDLPEKSSANLADDNAALMECINAIWRQKGVVFLNPYLEFAKRLPQAAVRETNFEDPHEAAAQMNKAASEATQGRIQELVAPDTLPIDTKLHLTNAIVFSCPWALSFDNKLTHEGEFHTALQGMVKVKMMRMTAHLTTREGEGWKAVELPLTDDRHTFTICLPSEPVDWPEFQERCNSQQLMKWLSQSTETSELIELRLPKFSTQVNVPLTESLARLGMPLVCGPMADLSKMTGDQSLYLSTALHRAEVTLDEQGVVAQAKTSMALRPKSLPRKRFVVDRPFLYLIREKSTGCAIFMGRVAQP